MAIAAYDENAKRADLTPLEEALALACIRDLGGNLSATEVARLTSQPERRVRRLLKLAAAPRVVTDAVSTGMLVDVADEGAKPKRERRLLELMAALEFARLHDFYLQSKPTTADERTTAAMTRALTGNWGFRRIQTYVDGILKAATGPTTAPQKDIPEQPITAPHPAAAEEALPEKSADEAGKGSMTKSAPEERDRETVVSSARTSGLFRLYVDRLKAASRAQLEAARTTIDDARRLIDAQLELLDQTGG
jgi:ParB-like chromosome segregation protein Spo0J